MTKNQFLKMGNFEKLTFLKIVSIKKFSLISQKTFLGYCTYKLRAYLLEKQRREEERKKKRDAKKK